LAPPSDASSVCSEPTEWASVSSRYGYLGRHRLQADREHHQTGDQDEDDDAQAQQQLQIELLQRQWKEAGTLYARTGDTSALLAVMAVARQSTVYWDPSGMPRF